MEGTTEMINTTPTRAECRAVALEDLRAFLADQVEMSSERIVAMETGVSRTALGKFIRGETNPHPRIRRLVAQYYIVANRREEEENLEKRRAALADLFPGVPETAIVAVLGEIYTEHGMTLPYWMARLRELAA
jgi:transcriptional regulator with XRE-family HTH domain